jgi:hypothetical protein
MKRHGAGPVGLGVLPEFLTHRPATPDVGIGTGSLLTAFLAIVGLADDPRFAG